MEHKFVILSKDNKGEFGAPVGKRVFSSVYEAEEHARLVLANSGTTTNQFEIFEICALVRRVSPPVETIFMRDIPKEEPPMKRTA